MYETDKNICGLNKADFQQIINGKQTNLYILKNVSGAEIAFTNYGGALAAIMMPDKNGQYANVVEGHNNLDGVINSPEPFLSTLIGRNANRIKEGKFQLDGKTYQLAINNGPNNLHGGPTGFHARVWDVEMLSAQSARLHYFSADGEEGFPGNVDVNVTYTLTDSNEFQITFYATTDQRTLVNLTHHAFFALAGLANPTPSVHNNVLTINADHYIPLDEVLIPYGPIAPVEGTPVDFRTPHVIGERIDADHFQIRHGAGYDLCYALNKPEAGQMTFAARCVEPNSGRCLEVYTTAPGLQIYTANYNSGFEGWHGTTFPARSAICFETGNFPDMPNHPYFPSCVLNPGEVYKHATIYKFTIAE